MLSKQKDEYLSVQIDGEKYSTAYDIHYSFFFVLSDIFK